MKKTTFTGRLILSVLAVVIVYCNLAEILNGCRTTIGTPELPLPTVGSQAFLLFGVFSSYDTNNEELTILGLPDHQEPGRKDWRTLPTADYIPGSRGDQQSRLWASMHSSVLGTEGRRQIWSDMGEKILLRHNFLHPEDKISKVALQSFIWPRSFVDFHGQTNLLSKRYWVLTKPR